MTGVCASPVFVLFYNFDKTALLVGLIILKRERNREKEKTKEKTKLIFYIHKMYVCMFLFRRDFMKTYFADSIIWFMGRDFMPW